MNEILNSHVHVDLNNSYNNTNIHLFSNFTVAANSDAADALPTKISDVHSSNKNKQIIFSRFSQPMKLMTTRCRMMWAKMKSAKARSGLIVSKCDLF